MTEKGPNGTLDGFVRAGDVRQAVDDLRRSLTIIYAQAQLLQRRNRLGIPPTPDRLERSANALATAAVAMIHTLNDLDERTDSS